jgi:hypothetical protein
MYGNLSLINQSVGPVMGYKNPTDLPNFLYPQLAPFHLIILNSILWTILKGE